MPQLALTSVPLTELIGEQYLQKHLNCSHCSWSGEAGGLMVKASSLDTDTARYACPECHEIIAQRTPVPALNVIEEIRTIRKLIAEVKVLQST
jgi:hypothetical protein